jgi:hypothetical protein
VSSLSSIVSYGLSTVYSPYGVSSLSSIISYGLSTVYSPYGVSSLSSIVSYGLSTVYSPYGVSSLSSIVSYGLSTVYSPYGISSLSSIVSYGLSTVYSPYGFSSLSSIISYGLSSLGGAGATGISSLSSIISYGLSTVYSPYGVSSLSSIISYGLSTVYSPYGISSLSSIISYGLSTVYSPYGVSSLSSIVSYGLSSLGGAAGTGISSLSSIISYGLSTVYSPYGISSLSSIVSYGLSTVSVIGNEVFKPYSVGGIGISSTNCNIEGPDSITKAFKKTEDWLFNNLLGQAPLPGYSFANTSNCNYAVFSITPPFQFKLGFLNRWLPHISTLNVTVTDCNNFTRLTFITGNRDYLPNSFVNSNIYSFYLDGSCNNNINSQRLFTNSSSSYRPINGYSNMWYLPCSNLSIDASPYVIRSWYHNYSTQPINIFSNIWYYANPISGFTSSAYNIFFTTCNDNYPPDT